MAIDFEAKILPSAFRKFGANMTFASPVDGSDVAIQVIDGTTEIQVGNFTQMDTTRPAVRARLSDVAALQITPADMVGVEIAYRGRAYTIRSAVNNPFDGAPGEILFILAEA